MVNHLWSLINNKNAYIRQFWSFKEHSIQAAKWMKEWMNDYCLTPNEQEQSMGRHVAPLRQIILIPSQPVFALAP